MKPTIYIAAPLFNEQQIMIIRNIEAACTKYNFPFLSPRLESEGLVPQGEEKKNPDAWNFVFEKNEQDINQSDLVIAVFDYLLPVGQMLGLAKNGQFLNWGEGELARQEFRCEQFTPLKLPDNGMVWEMGYARGLGRLVVGFSSRGIAQDLNVMLTKGCDGLVCGWEKLDRFLSGSDLEFADDFEYSNSLLQRKNKLQLAQQISIEQVVGYFDWTACEEWTSQQGGIHDAAA